MKKYRVVTHVTISVSTVVCAESEKAALKAAFEEDRGLECIHSQGDDEREWVTSGELDGEPSPKHATVEELRATAKGRKIR